MGSLVNTRAHDRDGSLCRGRSVSVSTAARDDDELLRDLAVMASILGRRITYPAPPVSAVFVSAIVVSVG